MAVALTHDGESPSGAVPLYIFTGVAALGSILLTALTADPLLRFHGYLLIAAFVIAFSVMTAGINNGRFRIDQSRYEDGVVKALHVEESPGVMEVSGADKILAAC